VLSAVILFQLLASSSDAGEGRKRVPALRGDWWQVAGIPELGALHSEEQQPVDFGIWQAADGSWQIWSCIRNTKEADKTRLFHRWEGKRLTDTNWREMGVAMRADTSLGERAGGLQAPYVLRDEGLFKMFYGDWNRICLATSVDGQLFKRHLRNGSPALFGDIQETNTRDAMVLRVGDEWICYYTAHPKEDGAVYARTSKDLLEWGDSKIVSYGGKVGTGVFYQAECPFVVEVDGFYYLFRTQYYGEGSTTHVYRSRDPLNFGVDDDRFYLTSLPVAAPELFEYDGQWYMACLLKSYGGIKIGRLDWVLDSEG